MSTKEEKMEELKGEKAIPISDKDIEKVLGKEIFEELFVIKTKDGTELRNKDRTSALKDLATIKGYKVGV